MYFVCCCSVGSMYAYAVVSLALKAELALPSATIPVCNTVKVLCKRHRNISARSARCPRPAAVAERPGISLS